MNFVQPIRDIEILDDIKKRLRALEDKRNYILFVLSINSGLRISDIRLRRVRDLKRPTIVITEKKTGKQKVFEMNPAVRKELLELVDGRDDNEYLIKSRQGVNKPIGRSMAYKILRGIGDWYGLESIGCHTTRKTYGYHYYKRTKDVATLQKIFNHSTPAYTLRYIGIEQDQINSATRGFRL